MLDSLTGLSVGDALGATFPIMGRSIPELRAGNLPAGPWNWTDDTEMACGVVAELCENGQIDQDHLAASFARHMDRDRDYGFFAVDTLRKVRDGMAWDRASGSTYDGQGSCGNGGAMRVAPLGAYFAQDPECIVRQAVRSAEVTHMHPEGVAGAVAVALGAGLAAHARISGTALTADQFITMLLARLDDGETSRGIGRALALLGAPVDEAAAELGNGSRVTAQDTVPFTVWVAATHLQDYPGAVATCVEAGGDMDTTAAIAGGIVSARTGSEGIPAPWLAAREPLPDWANAAIADASARGEQARSGRLRRWFSGR
ncbi:MAG: ADP-ribosylglycohydrolase family protein [Nocardia sp.]|nr:ADP-ribosylglycohydrolase family protein [Nocardia sp.]